MRHSASMSLTHWGRDKMDTIFQTFSNIFSWMKIYKFQIRFHWSLFPTVQLTIFQDWFSDNGFAPSRQQAIIWTNNGWFTGAYMHHSASVSLIKGHSSACSFICIKICPWVVLRTFMSVSNDQLILVMIYQFSLFASLITRWPLMGDVALE